jgi:hypothetical protein
MTMQVPDWITLRYMELEDVTIPAQMFVANKARATCILATEDPEACYSYDDWALCLLDGTYYVFSTSGCSCPMPEETWRLEFSGTKSEILEYMKSDANGYAGYAHFKQELSKLGETVEW